jgi:hypothetical protein
MDINLIDQQIIDSFFKYYKKDVKAIQFHEFKILKEKISQNLQELIHQEMKHYNLFHRFFILQQLYDKMLA